MATPIKSGFGYLEEYTPAPKEVTFTATTAVERRSERPEYKVSRGKKLSKSGSENYTKDTYNLNSFWVDTPIYLEAVGFFGPFEKTTEKYGVLLEVWRSKFSYEQGELIFKFKTEGRRISAKPKKIFYVTTDSLYLAPGFWYHIRFILGGPDTAAFDEKKMDNVRADVWVHPPGWIHDFRIRFQFLRGCKQVPELKFTVVPKEDLKTIRLPPAVRVNGYANAERCEHECVIL